MAIFCPEINDKVLYAACLECETKSCRKNAVSDGFPLYGLICNWKGLKEENRLYTWEQIKSRDSGAVPGGIWEGSFAPNKTYTVYPLRTWDAVASFLTGSLNGPDVDDVADIPDGWYWDNMYDDIWTGLPNPTMEKWAPQRKEK